MADKPRIAKGLLEAQLYLRVTLCPHCGKGSLIDAFDPAEKSPGDTIQINLEATCESCGLSAAFIFEVDQAESTNQNPTKLTINPGDSPSQLVDVGQWLVLCQLHEEEAQQHPDKVVARKLHITARLCVAEALKFYDDDRENDLPPSEAMWTDASRSRFKDTPQQFSRHRLIELKAKLPQS